MIARRIVGFSVSPLEPLTLIPEVALKLVQNHPSHSSEEALDGERLFPTLSCFFQPVLFSTFSNLFMLFHFFHTVSYVFIVCQVFVSTFSYVVFIFFVVQYFSPSWRGQY